VRDHKSGKLYGSPRSLTSITSVDTMSIQQCPPEIIEKIISIAADPILADHMNTLSMLALTCHAFRLLAQRCQYRHLQVGSRKRLDNLSQILTQNRHRYLHLYVKVLHLDDHILDLDDVGRSEDMLALGIGLRFSHPESFINVRELSLFRMQMVGLDERDLIEFARSFPAATIVRIWLVRFTTTENMIAFLVSFPRLEELFIDSQWWDVRDSDTPEQFHFADLKDWHTFQALGNYMCTRHSKAAAFPCLQSLSMQGINSNPWFSAWLLGSRTLHQLDSWTLSPGSRDDVKITSVIMSSDTFKTLRELVVNVAVCDNFLEG
jgi:hypothetical protein